MKGARMWACVLVLLGGMALSGCAVMAMGPVVGPLTIDEKGPVAVGPAATAPKTGMAVAQGILLVGWGDASISTAMANGNITKIHHVDCEVQNILGIYARYQTTVYGE